MNSFYTETMELRSCNCDMGGAWRPGAILEAMQETAGAHSALLGLDRETMLSMGIAWILSRLKVEFTRIPRVGERVLIETYPMPVKHMFFPRCHVFKDEAGEVIGRANSLWVTIDINDRRIVKNEVVAERVPGNTELGYAAGMPATVRPLGGEAVYGVIEPRYTDLDVNRHVNNTKYLDWCCNALGVDVMDKSVILAFDVNYDSEITPGCSVDTELSIAENRFSFIGTSDGKRRFSIAGTLAPRA